MYKGGKFKVFPVTCVALRAGSWDSHFCSLFNPDSLPSTSPAASTFSGNASGPNLVLDLGHTLPLVRPTIHLA